jgi:hypothetical protein
MAIVHQRIARPIPATGHDVHIYDYGSSAGVILIENGEIAWQDHTVSFEEAKRIGLDLMALHDCEMVEHHPYANRESE